MEAQKRMSSATSSGGSSFMETIRPSFLREKEPHLSPHDLRVWVSGSTGFPMHKDLFILASPVFESLVRNRLTNASPTSSTRSALSQIAVKIFMEPRVFKAIRHFLYTDELNPEIKANVEFALEILEVSFQYRIDRLLLSTTRHLKSIISAENAFKVLQSARSIECNELEDLALQVIHRHADELLFREEFLNLGCYDVCRILSSDALCCKREVDVFEAAYRWAKTKAGRGTSRSLKYYFSQISECVRFPLMSHIELATVTKDKDIIDSDDLVKLFQYVCLPEKPSFEFKYNTNRRSISSTPVTQHKRVSKISCKEAQTEQHKQHTLVLPPASSAKKRSCSESTENVTSAVVPPDPDSVSNKVKVARIEQNSDSSDDLFTVVTKYKVQQNKDFITYEELARRYDRENEKDSVSGFKFSNIVIQNNYRNMHFPSCREVEVDAQCKYFKSESDSFFNFISHFDPMRYILFNRSKGTDRLTAENIWSLNQDILLKFNGITFLRVTHAKEKYATHMHANNVLVLNYIQESKKILSNAKPNKPMELALSNCEFSVKFMKERAKHIEKLILYRVWGDFTLEEIMKEFPKLTELVCWKHVPTMNWYRGSQLTTPLCLNFSQLFSAKHNIRKVVLFKAELKFPVRCNNVATSVLELVLDHCHSVVGEGERNANISDVFHHVFPVIKSLVLVEAVEADSSGDICKDGNLAVPSLINCTRRIETIESILVYGMKWTKTDEDVELASLFELESDSDNLPEEYRLTKEDGEWNGRCVGANLNKSVDIDGGYWSTRDKEEFQWYHLHNFYDSYEVFEDYFKQEADKFPRPILWV